MRRHKTTCKSNGRNQREHLHSKCRERKDFIDHAGQKSVLKMTVKVLIERVEN